MIFLEKGKREREKGKKKKFLMFEKRTDFNYEFKKNLMKNQKKISKRKRYIFRKRKRWRERVCV